MMKKILSMLLLLTLVLSLMPVPKTHAKAAAQDTANSDIRVMSANVLAEFASWSGDGVAPPATSTRVVKLEQMLNENNPMVVGTQEMSPSWYTAFKKLDSTKWGWLEESDVAGYSYYDYVPNKGLALNSILYRKDLLTLNAHGVEAYSSRSNGQCIVWAVFTLLSNGKQFVFISTHWTPGANKANERLAQAEQLAKKVNSLRNTYGDTVICTGDFNCNDQTQEYRRFLINSNSLDSRGAAAKRGDHLLKIDHVTATADASFSYHTICYEANNAYAISDHPFAVADIKLGSALIFEFTDDTNSRAHYKQQNYRYNAYDYHAAYWNYDSALVSNRTINKTDGTLTFSASATGNPYLVIGTNSSTDPKTAYGLSFRTKEAQIARIKFKLSGNSLIDSSTGPSVTVGVANRSSGVWATNKKTYTLDKALSGYVTLDIPLTDSGVRSVATIDSLRLTFDNIKNGTVTIDSIYMGKSKTTPLSQSLFFDYSNTSTDQSRYGGTSYGGYQFDKASGGYWATKETSTTSSSVYSDYSISNSTGILSLKVAQGLAYNTANGKYGPWLTTTKSYGTYPGATASSQHPLQYNPKNAEFVQVAFKLQNCTLAAGSNPQVVVVYDYVTADGTTARGDYTMIGDYTLSNGTYTIVTIPVSQQFKTASKITTFGMRFWHIKGTSSSAKVEIDYIYVGTESGLPTKHVYDHSTTKATCTEQGYTTHTCRTCGYKSKDSYIPATGHSFGSGTVTTEPTCTKDGVKSFTCTVCGTGKTETIPAKGHEYKGEIREPSCTEEGYTTYTCVYCSDSYTEAKTEATGHTLVYCPADEGVHNITCEKCDYEEVEAHSYTDGLCVCGQIEAKEPVLQPQWKMGHSLNLASDISVNLAVSKTLLSGFDMDTVYVLSEMDVYQGNTKTGTKTVKLLPVEQGNYYYFTLDGLTAVHMNDSIRSTLYGTKDRQPYYSAVDDYSISAYAYSQMSKSASSETLRTLCADLLRYGTYAQIYKGYRTDTKADDRMTDVQRGYLSDMEAVTFGNTNVEHNDLENAPIVWAGKALNLGSKVALKLAFDPQNYTGDLSALTLRVRYRDIEGKEKNLLLSNPEIYSVSRGYYAFTLDAMLAAELRSVVSAQIYAGDTPVSCTLEYAADAYGNNKTGNLLQLCKALFAYSDSAKAYFVS